VIIRLTARKAVRSGVVWGYIFGASIASSALSYTQLYKTVAQRDALAAAFGSNNATSALFGPAPQLQTVVGFTVFKISMTLTIIGAVWGILTSTRLLRGEEDNGRWDLLLAGPTTRSGATSQALCGLGIGAFALWALTGLITVVVGLLGGGHHPRGGAVFRARHGGNRSHVPRSWRSDEPVGSDPPTGCGLRRLVARPGVRDPPGRRRRSRRALAQMGVPTWLG